MHLDATYASRGRRLESWKEIAAYLGRDVRTAQRWERNDQLPVRRLQHAKLASVYAYSDELDEWRLGREPGEPVAETTPQKPRRVRRLWFVGGIAMTVALGAAVALWPGRAFDRPAGTTPIRTIAVLPIANFSGDPQQEYFADGMTDALIAGLSTVPGLLVISRTSVMPFKQTQRRVPEIAKTLNVQGIVEGSVTRSEGRVRVTVKLIRAATDTTLWADVFDRESHDVLGLQSDVAQAIARQVETSLSQEDLARLAASVRSPRSHSKATSRDRSFWKRIRVRAARRRYASSRPPLRSIRHLRRRISASLAPTNRWERTSLAGGHHSKRGPSRSRPPEKRCGSIPIPPAVTRWLRAPTSVSFAGRRPNPDTGARSG